MTIGAIVGLNVGLLPTFALIALTAFALFIVGELLSDVIRNSLIFDDRRRWLARILERVVVPLVAGRFAAPEALAGGTA